MDIQFWKVQSTSNKDEAEKFTLTITIKLLTIG
jgi:hypothetical protein